MNKPGMNIWVPFLGERIFLILLGIYFGVELLDHIVIMYLIFWVTTKLASTPVSPFHIPTSNVWAFSLLHIFTNTRFFCFCCCFVLNSHSKGCEVVSHCGFELYSPNWLLVIGYLYMFFEKSLFKSFACRWNFGCFLFVSPHFWLVCNDQSCCVIMNERVRIKAGCGCTVGPSGAPWRQRHWPGPHSLAGFIPRGQCGCSGGVEAPRALAEGHITGRL